MSRTQPTRVDCPDCGETQQVDKASSVNVDRHPELRAAILDGSFQRHACACGLSIQLAPSDLSYLDVGRKQWIVAQPHGSLSEWRKHEAQALTMFDQALGSQAPAVAQEIGEGISPRVVFGWAALREKLIAKDLGLDEVALECTKMQLMKHEQIVPQAGHDLRLTGLRDDALLVEVIDVEAQTPVSSYGAPRALYDEVLAKPKAWAPIASQLTGAFVDIQRLFWDG